MAARALLAALLLACCVAPGAAQRGRKPAVHTITIDATTFSPASLTIKAGDAVVWVNKDLFPHTATTTANKAIDSGVIAPGKSYRQGFRGKGEFPYICTLHTTMKGKLIVE